MTDNTQADEYLQEQLVEQGDVSSMRYIGDDYTRIVTIREDRLLNIITADRKRVALEARLDENNMYIRELTRHYFPSSPSEPHIPLVQFHERIAELKAQQEEL